MLFKALSAAVYGIDANLIEVEVDYSGTITEDNPTFSAFPTPRSAKVVTVSAPPSRTPATLIPPTFITINLAPADMKKEGSGFDLPIAVGILGAYGALKSTTSASYLMVGELGLDGSSARHPRRSIHRHPRPRARHSKFNPSPRQRQ